MKKRRKYNKFNSTKKNQKTHILTLYLFLRLTDFYLNPIPNLII